MKSYRDLIVWKKAINMVKEVYQLVAFLPKDEQYALTSQIRRSAVSVPSNIAEGYGRQHKKEYMHFLQISRGSLYEMQTQLEIAVMVGYITNEKLRQTSELSIEIEKMLNSLITKLNGSK